jgi:hypothetical protein
MEDSAHARIDDLSAAAEVFANGTYFPKTLRSCLFSFSQLTVAMTFPPAVYILNYYNLAQTTLQSLPWVGCVLRCVLQ